MSKEKHLGPSYKIRRNGTENDEEATIAEILKAVEQTIRAARILGMPITVIASCQITNLVPTLDDEEWQNVLVAAIAMLRRDNPSLRDRQISETLGISTSQFSYLRSAQRPLTKSIYRLIEFAVDHEELHLSTDVLSALKRIAR